MSVISGGGVAPLHNPLPDLVLLRVEVEVDLPLGLEHHLTGTDGTRLFVGETHHGHHVGNLVELLEHVHLILVLPLLVPGLLRPQPLDAVIDPEASSKVNWLVVHHEVGLLNVPPGNNYQSRDKSGQYRDSPIDEVVVRHGVRHHPPLPLKERLQAGLDLPLGGVESLGLRHRHQSVRRLAQHGVQTIP